MFSVLFEVHPKPEQREAYLGYAKRLRPELEQIEGFVDNIRYRSLTREGWILSLSGWRDEKSLIRWRTRERHHEVQEKGRSEVFLDYHLRVGQVTRDTRLPEGYALARTATGRDRNRRRHHRNADRRQEAGGVGEERCCGGCRERTGSAGERIRPRRLGCLRCRSDTRRDGPVVVMARRCRCRYLRACSHACLGCETSSHPRGAGLWDVRPSRGSAILSAS